MAALAERTPRRPAPTPTSHCDPPGGRALAHPKGAQTDRASTDQLRAHPDRVARRRVGAGVEVRNVACPSELRWEHRQMEFDRSEPRIERSPSRTSLRRDRRAWTQPVLAPYTRPFRRRELRWTRRRRV